MADKTTFSINDEILIKLNDHGKAIFDKTGYIREYHEKENGYWKFHIWELASIFGQHLFNGCQMPFENTSFIYV